MFASLSIPALIVGILAVWRIAHLFWGEDGPGDIFVTLRRKAGEGFFGKLLDCFYCLSLWIAIPFAYALGGTWPERGILWFALSGGAILVERATSKRPPPPPPVVWEERPLPSENSSEDIQYVMLR